MSQLSAKKCNLTEVVEKAFCVFFFVFPYPKINQDARRAEHTWERKQVVEQGEDLSFWYIIQVEREGEKERDLLEQHNIKSMLSRVPSQVAVFASLCTQVSRQQLWSTRHQITFQIRHNATDPKDGLASFPPVWQVPDASARCISSSRLDASSQSWEVGNVGKEALSPPLLQVYGHKVCTEGRTAGETRDENLTSAWIKWASTFSTREQNVTLTAEEFQPASLIDSLSFTWMESSFCHVVNFSDLKSFRSS